MDNRFMIILLLGLMCGVQPQAAAQDARTHPNIIFLLADDLGWGDLSCYGNTKISTPHLDRLATTGKLFTQFYASASVCSPSRAAFLTGRFPARDSIHGHLAEHELNAARSMPDFLNPGLTTLPRLLKQQGYATAHFGKWHLGAGLHAPDLNQYGFDDYKIGAYNSDQPWKLGDTSTQMDIGSPESRPWSAARVADQVIRYVRANRDQPFYVNGWFLDVHATLNPSAAQLDAVRHLGISEKVPFVSAAQVYYGTLLELDRQIGRIIAALEETGILENTIVIFSSDNGPEDINVINSSHSGVGSTGPFRGRKRSLYEGGIRMPFIVSWPSHIPAGQVDDASVIAGVDLLPSLAVLAGVSLPPSMALDGEDRSSCWLGDAAERSKPLFWEWRFNIAGQPFHKSPTLCIREGEWKLLMNEDESRKELYHLENDRLELVNLTESHPTVVHQLSTALLAWKKTLPTSTANRQAGRVAYAWPNVPNEK